MPSLRPAHPGWLSWWSSFLGGEERFGARRVVGDVCQADHLGHAGAQQGLDALADGHLRQAAALTPAFQADVDPAVLGLDQDHPTAVGGDHRVDLRVQDTARPVGETLRSEEHTSELQSRPHLVCRLLLEKKNKKPIYMHQFQTW